MPTVGSENRFPKIRLVEGAAPATPASGEVHLYVKSDGLLYWKDDAGVEYAVSTGGDVSVHLADASGAHAASAVSIVDAGTYFTGTDVEAALQELGAISGGTPDAEDVPIADAGTYFTGTDVEAALQELGAAGAAGGYVPPEVEQFAETFTASGTSTVVTMAAPTVGTTLIALVHSSSRGCNSITQTNVTWTQRYTGNGNSRYVEVWTGVVAASPGTTATFAFTGSNQQLCAVYELVGAPAFTAATAAQTTTGSAAALVPPFTATGVTPGAYCVWAITQNVTSAYNSVNMPWTPGNAGGGAGRSGVLRATHTAISVWSVGSASQVYFGAIVVLT